MTMAGLTVILATFNGAETIVATLDALTRLEPPTDGWKLVVIDNGSTDGTKELVETFAGRLPLQLLECPVPNKNAALNTALEHIEGDLIVFTDDDIVPEPDWLVEFRCLASEQPSFAIFGGRIRPLWPSDPPPWIVDGIPLGPAYAAHPDDLDEGPISPGRIWGGNMAVRRRVFDAGHRFDEAFGPRQSRNFVMRSETEFSWRIHNIGGSCWFSNRIQVGHQILPIQFTPSWLAARARRYGATRASHLWGTNVINPRQTLLAAVRKLRDESMRWVLSWPAGNRTARYNAIWGINYQLGYLRRRLSST